MGASLSAKDISSLLAFVRDLYAIRDLPSFRSQVVSRISRLVHSEVTSYNEVNWERQQNASMSDHPGALDFPDSHRIFDQHMREHALIGHYARTGHLQALKMSDFLTRSQFHRSGLYTDFYRRVGIEHQMAFVVPAPTPLVIGFALNRSRPDFSERDRLLLNLVRPHLVQAYRNAEAVSLLLNQGQPASAAEESERAAILVGARRRICLMTDSASRFLAKYFSDSSRARPRLPDILDTWVKQQEEASWFGTSPHFARTPLVVDQEKSRLFARLLSGKEYSLLILEEQSTTLEPRISQSFGLTAREAEVLRWVARGKTNAEIADILAMSPRTVQKHLERVFQKLGVETRTAAAVCILQTGGRVFHDRAVPPVVSGRSPVR